MKGRAAQLPCRRYHASSWDHASNGMERYDSDTDTKPGAGITLFSPCRPTGHVVDEKAEQWSAAIAEVQDRLSRAFEFLAKEDVFGAVLQLQKVRALVNSLSASLPKTVREETGDLSHDWRVADPYTAQCRICGKQRPLSAAFYRLDPLLPLTAL